MKEGTALEIAERKMYELGVGSNYLIRYRHILLDPKEKVKIKGQNQLYILIEPDGNCKVASKSGVYDERDVGINELQYSHRGTIEIVNLTSSRSGIKFIQVIPNTNCKPKN